MKRNFELSVRSLKSIADEPWHRDQVLLAADSLVRAVLEDDWSLEEHMMLKDAVLGVLDFLITHRNTKED